MRLEDKIPVNDRDFRHIQIARELAIWFSRRTSGITKEVIYSIRRDISRHAVRTWLPTIWIQEQVEDSRYVVADNVWEIRNDKRRIVWILEDEC